MGDREERLKCINEIKELSKYKKSHQKEGLLKLFATYVYLTNPDYKYNETYLKDMIPDFWINVEKYTVKVDFRDKIFCEIQKIHIPNCVKFNFNIQIDDTWELIFDNLRDESARKWAKKISEMPNLNSVANNKTYVKCQFNNSQGKFFSDYLVSDDNLKLIKFVTDSIRFFIDRWGVVDGD